MLEKITENLKKNDFFCENSLFDAHFHYFECEKLGICDFPAGWAGISCAHAKNEFFAQKKAAVAGLIHSYGMHPQNAANENILDSADFLEELLQHKEISFIGEAGFDFFTSDFKSAEVLQEKIWNIQLDLALKYNVALVVHCRKANHKLFEYSSQLKKLPEVLFHSFMGSPVEALSLCRRGINAYFSFGKQLLNGNKKAIACVCELPAEKILAETDAPFQTLKGESFTKPSDILKVYEAIKTIRGI